jgi:hypothetical protein
MTKKHVKLAEALLRRKELQAKVKQLETIKNAQVFENRISRVKVHEGIDEITASVAKLTASQVTHEYDWHARQLRLVDAAIQHINWTAEVEVDESTFADYVAPSLK